MTCNNDGYKRVETGPRNVLLGEGVASCSVVVGPPAGQGTVGARVVDNVLTRLAGSAHPAARLTLLHVLHLSHRTGGAAARHGLGPAAAGSTPAHWYARLVHVQTASLPPTHDLILILARSDVLLQVEHVVYARPVSCCIKRHATSQSVCIEMSNDIGVTYANSCQDKLKGVH